MKRHASRRDKQRRPCDLFVDERREPYRGDRTEDGRHDDRQGHHDPAGQQDPGTGHRTRQEEFDRLLIHVPGHDPAREKGGGGEARGRLEAQGSRTVGGPQRNVNHGTMTRTDCSIVFFSRARVVRRYFLFQIVLFPTHSLRISLFPVSLSRADAKLARPPGPPPWSSRLPIGGTFRRRRASARHPPSLP